MLNPMTKIRKTNSVFHSFNYTMSNQMLSLFRQQEIELLEKFVVSLVSFTIVFCSLNESLLGHLGKDSLAFVRNVKFNCYNGILLTTRSF